MRNFKVSWTTARECGSKTLEAKDQCDAIMKIMKYFSPDGIHAPQCKIFVKPIC